MSDVRFTATTRARAVVPDASSFAASTAVAIVAAVAIMVMPSAARAQSSAPQSSPTLDVCALVDSSEVATIVGYPVEPPDVASRAAGICFFTTRSISQDGSATYAVVTGENLAQRRTYAAAQARRCAGVAKGAPNALACKGYADLALADSLDAYFTARTSTADASPVPSLGPGAIAAPNALYVRDEARIVEVVVRRGETLDIDREIALAKLVLERLPHAATPKPSSSPQKPKPKPKRTPER
ncbi:MAG: hypothetical protein NVS2B8_09680 [Vulcanimicrobiaceae bacterium]